MIKFYGTIKNFSFLPEPNMILQWNEFCKKNNEKRVSMGAAGVFKKRTLDQNSTLYGPWVDHCIRLHRHIGDQALRESLRDDLHSCEAKWWIQVNFFPRRKYLIMGNPHQRIPGSSELSTVEFMDALNNYNMFSVGQGYSEFVPKKDINEEYEEV